MKKLKDVINLASRGVSEKFIDHYNVALLDMNPPKPAEKRELYTPSSLGNCKRNIYYTMKGYERDGRDLSDDMTYNIVGILESGTDRHERIQSVLFHMEQLGHIKNIDIEQHCLHVQEKGIQTHFVEWDGAEGKCKNLDAKLSFKADGLFEMDGKTFIFEIKTMNIFKFKKAKSMNRPLPEHITQATAYSIAFGVDDVIFFYEDRDFTQHLVLHYKVTDIDRKSLLAKVKQLDEMLATNELPPMESDKCTYCDFKSRCKEEK